MGDLDTPTKMFEGGAQLRSHAIELSSIVGGKYKVLSLIGRGGMGSVYRVEHVFLHAEFAMKTMDSAQLTDVMVRRFQQEAKALASLRHQNVVQVHDFGLIDEQQPFYVMDLVEGQSLQSYLSQHDMLPVDLAKQVFSQICLGLQAAHELGVVHRDIKPANIVWRNPGQMPAEGDIKIIDFGIAKLANFDGHTLTATGDVIGSPSYMSPEQCMGLAVDARSDIYTLGCMFFEMLTGLRPFVADSALATMMKHQSEPAPTLKEATLGKEYPPEIEHIIQKMLRKEPSARYSSVTMILMDLHADDPSQLISRQRKNQEEISRTQKKIQLDRKVLIVLLTLHTLITALVSALITVYVLGILAPQKKSETKIQQSASLGSSVFAGDTLPVNVASGRVEVGKLSVKQHPTALPFSRPHVGDSGFTLDFGTVSWGTVTFAERKYQALGKIDVPPNTKVVWALNPIDQQIPVFSAFRGNEFDAIHLGDAGTFTNSMIKDIGKFKTLNVLRLGVNKLDDGSFRYFNQLPQLKTLDGRFNKLTTAGWCSFKGLGRLHYLRYGPVENPGKVLKVLSGSKITSLGVDGEFRRGATSLNDADLDHIAAIPDLYHLTLGHHSKLSARGIARLSKGSLRELFLRDVNLRASDFDQLSKLRKLNSITLIDEHYKPGDRALLLKAMPWLKPGQVTVATDNLTALKDKRDLESVLLRYTEPLNP